MNASKAAALVRKLLDTEIASGFPFVGRFPSVEVWKALVHLETLPAPDGDIILDILAERGSGLLAFFDRQGAVAADSPPTNLSRA